MSNILSDFLNFDEYENLLKTVNNTRVFVQFLKNTNTKKYKYEKILSQENINVVIIIIDRTIKL